MEMEREKWEVEKKGTLDLVECMRKGRGRNATWWKGGMSTKGVKNYISTGKRIKETESAERYVYLAWLRAHSCSKMAVSSCSWHSSSAASLSCILHNPNTPFAHAAPVRHLLAACSMLHYGCYHYCGACPIQIQIQIEYIVAAFRTGSRLPESPILTSFPFLHTRHSSPVPHSHLHKQGKVASSGSTHRDDYYICIEMRDVSHRSANA